MRVKRVEPKSIYKDLSKEDDLLNQMVAQVELFIFMVRSEWVLLPVARQVHEPRPVAFNQQNSSVIFCSFAFQTRSTDLEDPDDSLAASV